MKLFLILLIVGCAVALPKSYYRRYAQSARLQAANPPRLRRAPVHRAMLIHTGYYRPIYAQRRQGYEPETAMTAFATGDSVAAGSYLGASNPNCITCNEDPESDAENVNPELDQTQDEAPEPLADVPAEVEVPKKKTGKKVKQPEADDDDVGEEDSQIIPKPKGPAHTYFPIVFRGYGGSRSANGGSGGGVTAIANSYSTGKGGVATSHATAYGGPPPSRSRKRNQPNQAEEDDEE